MPKATFNHQKFRSALEARRAGRHITEAAEECGLKAETLNNHERGLCTAPRLDHLALMCRWIGAPMESFFDFS